MKTSSSPSDFRKIPGLTLSVRRLLQASGVNGLVDLAKSHPSKLWRWMAEVNADQRLVRRMPQMAAVVTWVEMAKSVCS